MSRKRKARQCKYGFTPVPGCKNCSGTGVFTSIDTGSGEQNEEACVFCLEDAIIDGEIDGSINGVVYHKGQVSATF